MSKSDNRPARAGDVIEIRGIPGAETRHGVIEEVLGEGAHEHYLVRWDERNVSLFFPGSGEGVHVRAPHGHRSGAPS